MIIVGLQVFKVNILSDEGQGQELAGSEVMAERPWRRPLPGQGRVVVVVGLDRRQKDVDKPEYRQEDGTAPLDVHVLTS